MARTRTSRQNQPKESNQTCWHKKKASHLYHRLTLIQQTKPILLHLLETLEIANLIRLLIQSRKIDGSATLKVDESISRQSSRQGKGAEKDLALLPGEELRCANGLCPRRGGGLADGGLRRGSTLGFCSHREDPRISGGGGHEPGLELQINPKKSTV